jgi:hypothetical protein
MIRRKQEMSKQGDSGGYRLITILRKQEMSIKDDSGGYRLIMIRRKQEISKQRIRTDDHERLESRTSGFMRIETLPYISFPLTALSLQTETSDSERLDFLCVQ